MRKSKFRQFLPAIVVALALAAGCETVSDRPSSKVSDPPWAKEATPGVERWKCGDYFDGCGLFSGDCVTLTANVHAGTGEVEFSDFVEQTEFRIDGIERRWNWCMADDYSYRCSFIVSVDGTGRYYKFSDTDKTAKARDWFKCTRQ